MTRFLGDLPDPFQSDVEQMKLLPKILCIRDKEVVWLCWSIYID